MCLSIRRREFSKNARTRSDLNPHQAIVDHGVREQSKPGIVTAAESHDKSGNVTVNFFSRHHGDEEEATLWRKMVPSCYSLH